MFCYYYFFLLKIHLLLFVSPLTENYLYFSFAIDRAKLQVQLVHLRLR